MAIIKINKTKKNLISAIAAITSDIQHFSKQGIKPSPPFINDMSDFIHTMDISIIEYPLQPACTPNIPPR
jgi:hypothetical protein